MAASPAGPPPTGAHDRPGGLTPLLRRFGSVTGEHPVLDRIAGLAARLLAAPSAQVSLLGDVQTVAGGSGLAPGAVGSQGPLADSLCTVTATGGTPLVVTDAPRDARVAALPPVTSGAVGSYLGVPLALADAPAFGALCVFDPAPRAWSEADVAVLQELAASAVGELERSTLELEHETSRVLWELAIEAAGVGTFDLDVESGVLRWDEQMLRLFAYAPDEFDGSLAGFSARLHPDDLPRVTQAVEQAVSTGGRFSAEYRVLLPDGRTRWVDARGRALVDRDGRTVRLLGAAHDATDRQEQEAQVRRVLEAMSAAFYSLDAEWRFTYVNAEAERLLGRTRDELLGGVLWDLFPAAAASEFEVQYRRAADTGEPVTFDAYYPAPLDGWYELRVWPSGAGLSVYFLDITARRRAQAEAETAAARAALLADVTAELSETLDAEQAVHRLAQLVVPALADWCVVSLVDDDSHDDWRRRVRDAGSWHVDPGLRPLVERYRELRLPSLTDTSYLARAVREGRAVTVEHGARAAVAQVLGPGEARDLVERLAPESVMVLPLRGRRRTVGLLTLFRGADRGGLRREDVQTAREVAGRAGLSLDNARLYHEQRQLAEALQRSLLTDPPSPVGAQVAVRYEPAAETAQVGGDWYDAFLQPGGDTVLVIGDVVGHDSAAAAAMGQVRGLLRGLAADSGAGPADVLRRVDRVLQTLQIETTATAVVARLEQLGTDAPTLCWSSAGHPPPMLLRTGAAGATVDVLDSAEADLLLGIDPSVHRNEYELALEPGATVLLYTDGLVERRGQSLDEGLARLRETLLALGRDGLPLEGLCDEVLRRMLPPDPEDDVALVALRLPPRA